MIRKTSDRLDTFYYHDAAIRSIAFDGGDLVLLLADVSFSDERPDAALVELRFEGVQIRAMETWACRRYDAQGRLIEDIPLRKVPPEEWSGMLMDMQGPGAFIFGLSQEDGVITLDVAGVTTELTAAVHLTWEEPDFTGVRWLFFDVGSTLIDETAAYEHRIREMIAGTDVTYKQFQRKRMEFARQNKRGDLEAAEYFGLTKTPWHHEDERPYPDAEAVLRTLKARGYCIGIIANQSAGTAERLSAWGLLAHIDLLVASAEEGVSKPDPAIFRIALERAGCRPHEAMMIGDRLDNDIAPAKAVGMRTIWLPQGPAEWQLPRCAEEKADAVARRLTQLTGILTNAAED